MIESAILQFLSNGIRKIVDQLEEKIPMFEICEEAVVHCFEYACEMFGFENLLVAIVLVLVVQIGWRMKVHEWAYKLAEERTRLTPNLTEQLVENDWTPELELAIFQSYQRRRELANLQNSGEFDDSVNPDDLTEEQKQRLARMNEVQEKYNEHLAKAKAFASMPIHELFKTLPGDEVFKTLTDEDTVKSSPTDELEKLPELVLFRNKELLNALPDQELYSSTGQDLSKTKLEKELPETLEDMHTSESDTESFTHIKEISEFLKDKLESAIVEGIPKKTCVDSIGDVEAKDAKWLSRGYSDVKSRPVAEIPDIQTNASAVDRGDKHFQDSLPKKREIDSLSSKYKGSPSSKDNLKTAFLDSPTNKIAIDPSHRKLQDSPTNEIAVDPPRRKFQDLPSSPNAIDPMKRKLQVSPKPMVPPNRNISSLPIKTPAADLLRRKCVDSPKCRSIADSPKSRGEQLSTKSMSVEQALRAKKVVGLRNDLSAADSVRRKPLVSPSPKSGGVLAKGLNAPKEKEFPRPTRREQKVQMVQKHELD